MKSKVSIPAILTMWIEHENLQNEGEIKQQAIDDLQNKDMLFTDLAPECEEFKDITILVAISQETEDPEMAVTIMEANKE